MIFFVGWFGVTRESESGFGGLCFTTVIDLVIFCVCGVEKTDNGNDKLLNEMAFFDI